MPTRRCASRGRLAEPAPCPPVILAQCESRGLPSTPSSRGCTAEFGDVIETTGPQHCSHGSSSRAPGSVPPAPWACPLLGPPSLGSSPYLTRHPVGAELPKAQGWLDPSQQSHHVQVFDPAPAGGQQAGGLAAPPGAASCSEAGPRGEPGDRAGCLAAHPPSGSGSGSLKGQFALPTASTGLFWGQDSLRYGVSRPGIWTSSPWLGSSWPGALGCVSGGIEGERSPPTSHLTGIIRTKREDAHGGSCRARPWGSQRMRARSLVQRAGGSGAHRGPGSGRGGGSASPSSPRLLAVDRVLSSPGLERLLRRWAPASVHAEAGRPLLSKAKGASLGGAGSCGDPSTPGHPSPLIWDLGQ